MRHHCQRKSPRLKGYDYSREGAYFVTICTYNRAHLFGSVIDGVMRLNDYGTIAAAEWDQTVAVRPNVDVPVLWSSITSTTAPAPDDLDSNAKCDIVEVVKSIHS
jgi:hypothetical protein